MLTTLYTGGEHSSHIDLPLFTGKGLPGPQYHPHKGDEFPVPVRSVASGLPGGSYSHAFEEASQEHSVRFIYDRSTKTVLPNLTTLSTARDLQIRVNDIDPAFSSMRVLGQWEVTQDGRPVVTISDGELKSTRSHFELTINSSVSEAGRKVRERVWTKRVRRNDG
jgi:hypothetical protein